MKAKRPFSTCKRRSRVCLGGYRVNARGRLVITGKLRRKIGGLARSHKAERRMVFRAQIIWSLAEERLTPKQIAARLGTTAKTVRKWRDRFIENGLEDLRMLCVRAGPDYSASLSGARLLLSPVTIRNLWL